MRFDQQLDYVQNETTKDSITKMKLNHFLISLAMFSSYFGITTAPAYAGRVFDMPNFDGRYIDLCASYYAVNHSTDPGGYVCYRGNTAQEIVASAFCRQVGMSYAVRWRYIEDSWQNRRLVWQLSQDTIVQGYQLRDDSSSYDLWRPTEGGHYFTRIECE